MPGRTQLLDRLDAIGASLSRRDGTLALLGVGSVGAEVARVDRWSDLDFFVIVEPGAKRAYIDDLRWLAEPAPIAWSFRNTPDGHKALYDDGVLCEFAVFEPGELRSVAYSPGRVVWRRAGFDDDIAQPTLPTPAPTSQPAETIVDEALSNLYVGLLRWHRGERLAAMRMVQVFAVDRLLELIEREPSTRGVTTDPFDLERRVEFRHPDWADVLARCCQGIDRTPDSALSMLDALARVAMLDDAIVEPIEHLAGNTRRT
jgi:hypothetical protein